MPRARPAALAAALLAALLVGRRYLSARAMEPLLEERLHRPDEEEVLQLGAA